MESALNNYITVARGIICFLIPIILLSFLWFGGTGYFSNFEIVTEVLLIAILIGIIIQTSSENMNSLKLLDHFLLLSLTATIISIYFFANTINIYVLVFMALAPSLFTYSIKFYYAKNPLNKSKQ